MRVFAGRHGIEFTSPASAGAAARRESVANANFLFGLGASADMRPVMQLPPNFNVLQINCAKSIEEGVY